jgi:general secretion pathway protein K
MNKQQGIAVITVLLIVALISSSIILLLNQQSNLIANTQTLLRQTKAMNYFYSAKSLIEVMLLDDKDLNSDDTDEDWYKLINQDYHTIPIDDAVITNQLVPLNSKLNLNNVFKINNNQVQIRSNPNFSTCLFKLANHLEITPLTDIFAEYLNSKEDKSLFTSADEIRNITAIPRENYYKIKPFIFVLPGLTKINLNTAPKEILMCLHHDLGKFNAEEMIKNRPFKTLDIAKAELKAQLPHLEDKEIDSYFNGVITTKSKYFLLTTIVDLADIKLEAKAILVRENKKIRTYMREFDYKLK